MVDHIVIDSEPFPISYTVGSSPRTDFSAPGPYFDATDIVVTIGGTLLSPSNYTLTGTAVSDGFSSGEIVLDTAVTNTVVIVDRILPIIRTTFIPLSGPLDINALNTQLSKSTAIDQQLDAKIDGFADELDENTTLVETLVANFNASIAIYATVAAATAATVAAAVFYIQTAGLLAAGDGGGGLYVRSASLVAGGFTSADGAFWAPAETQSASTTQPIIILAEGQSNITEAPLMGWTPASNAFMWNWDGVEGHIGTAFTPISSIVMGVSEKFASEVALANPDRRIYLIKIGFGGMDISHWLPGATSPDMFAITTGNVPPALAAIGATSINVLLWWQGETGIDAPGLYLANFETLQARFRLESWFPRSTPIVVFGIAPTLVTTNDASDMFNDYLHRVVAADPDLRRFVDSDIGGTSYWNPLAPVHRTALGYELNGATAAVEFLQGSGHVSKVPATAIQALEYGGLQVNGDHVVSQRYGSTAVTGITATSPVMVSDGHKIGTAGAAVLSAQIVADAPSGLGQSLKITVTTPSGSLSGVDNTVLYQRLEGYRVRKLKMGINTAAVPFSIVEWLKSSVACTVHYSVSNAANTRTYLQAVTIPANVWTPVGPLYFPGCNDGVWATDNATGVEVRLCLAASSAFLGQPGQWLSGSYLADPFGAQTNITATNGATFQRSGLFIVRGLEVPDPRHLADVMRSREHELVECSRQFYAVTRTDGQINAPLFDGLSYSTTNALIRAHYPKMRASPSLIISAASDFAVARESASSVVLTALTGLTLQTNQNSVERARLDAVTAGSLTAGQAVQLWQNSASALLGFDASL